MVSLSSQRLPWHTLVAPRERYAAREDNTIARWVSEMCYFANRERDKGIRQDFDQVQGSMDYSCKSEYKDRKIKHAHVHGVMNRKNVPGIIQKYGSTGIKDLFFF